MTAIVHLNKSGYHGAIQTRHPWVYGNEINTIEGSPAATGDMVSVVNHKGQFVGRGFLNLQSQIRVRLLTHTDEKCNLDVALLTKRITDAWKRRKKLGFTNNCRLVFGEADYLPGLVIDKFGDVLVIQTLSFAMDKLKKEIASILTELLKPRGIFERNDAPVRGLEGLPLRKGFLSEPFDTKIIVEDDNLKFFVDVENGQKTGFFLDQRLARNALQNIVPQADVLDFFCHTGSFSLYSAWFGAKSVKGFDVSAESLSLARENASLNGLDTHCQFEEANAFDKLSELSESNYSTDVIILDPPAFTKNRAQLDGALRGYKEINLRALKMIKEGGFLVTCSCTHFLTAEVFKEVIFDAAFDAKRKVRQVDFITQPPDHPILWGFPESSYLKVFILEIS